MRKTLSILSLAILAACTSQGPTTPDLPTSEAPAPVAAPATPAPSTPTVVPPPDEGRGVTVTFGNNASWDVHNNNGQASEFWAYTTDFDNQDLAREVKYGLVQNGDHFADTFGHGCVQLDITQEQTVVGGRGGHPIAAAYYDQSGKKVSRIDDAIRKACNAKPCVEPRETPTTPGAYSWSDAILEGQCEQESLPVGIDTVAPALNCHQIGTQKWAIDYTCQADGERVANLCRNVACPTPPPCEPTFTERTVVVNGPWSNVESSCGSRTITTTVYTLNSCTQQEASTVTTRTETLECPHDPCYYNVPGRNGETTCRATPGFVSWEERNHLCGLTFPGFCSSDFNLNQGQSDACLKWTGGDRNCDGVHDPN